MLALEKAGIRSDNSPKVTQYDSHGFLISLDERIKMIFNDAKAKKNKPGYMLFFVMYDIENNKVRTLVADYLQKKGCVRVQKSIYLANLPRGIYSEISTDLKEVQQTYDNADSIFLVPVSTDEIRAMKVIGKSVDFELVLGNKNTLFF